MVILGLPCAVASLRRSHLELVHKGFKYFDQARNVWQYSAKNRVSVVPIVPKRSQRRDHLKEPRPDNTERTHDPNCGKS